MRHSTKETENSNFESLDFSQDFGVLDPSSSTGDRVYASRPENGTQVLADVKFHHNCGEGPWYVFLMLNVAPKSFKQTEIRIHTHPSTVEYVQNMMYSTRKDLWRIVLSVGPFVSFERAVDFFKAWADKTRGCPSRFSKCVSLMIDPRFKPDCVSIYVTPFSPFDAENVFGKVEKLRSEFFVSSVDMDSRKKSEPEVVAPATTRSSRRGFSANRFSSVECEGVVAPENDDPTFFVMRALLKRDAEDARRNVLGKWWQNRASLGEKKESTLEENDYLMKLEDIFSQE